jgi:hypothetical protein
MNMDKKRGGFHWLAKDSKTWDDMGRMKSKEFSG